MKILYVADLHYSLKQFDWLVANARPFDVAAVDGDLLDAAGALDPDVQIAVVERYLRRLRSQTRLLVVSGNHDADARMLPTNGSLNGCCVCVEMAVRGRGRSFAA